MKKLLVLMVVLLSLFSISFAQIGSADMFINRTRLIQVGDGTPDNPQAFQNPRVEWTSPAGVVAETVDALLSFMPAGQRPAAEDLWQYAVEWEVRTYMVSTVRGVIPYQTSNLTATLIVDVDFWHNETEFLANPLNPLVRNTFIFVLNQKPRSIPSFVREKVDAWLINATFANWTGDRRDPAQAALASLNPLDDPRNLLIQAADLNNQARTLSGWVSIR